MIRLKWLGIDRYYAEIFHAAAWQTCGLFITSFLIITSDLIWTQNVMTGHIFWWRVRNVYCFYILYSINKVQLAMNTFVVSFFFACKRCICGRISEWSSCLVHISSSTCSWLQCECTESSVEITIGFFFLLGTRQDSTEMLSVLILLILRDSLTNF